MICFAGILITNLSYAQNEFPTRKAFTLTIVVSKDTLYEDNVPKTPYLVNTSEDKNILQLYPGESIYLEVQEIQNDSIKKMSVVKENLNPAKTIQVTFLQAIEKGEHRSMILKISNPFPKKVGFNALILPLRMGKWEETSVNMVGPKQMDFETTWDEIIVSIGLEDWIFKDE